MVNLRLDRPLRAKYDAKYWCDQLTAAEDRRKIFFGQAKESIALYRGLDKIATLGDVERKLNVWWYLVNTLLPAYYSSTPKAESNLRKRVGGIQYQLASVCLERNVQYCIEENFDFPLVGYNSAQHLLLTGQAVLWARFKAEFTNNLEKFSVLRDEQGQLVDVNGNPYDQEEADEIQETATGADVQRFVENKTDEKAILDVLQYNDYLTSDGRNESEIEWRSRRAFLSREDALELFGKDTAKKLKYDAYPEAIKRNQLKTPDKVDGKAELFEVYCEASGKVYWIQKRGDKSVLEEGQPPIKFEGFYPCSVITATTDPDTTIPVSDYTHCKDMILEVERLTTRIASVTQAIRSNGLYDATLGVQVEQLLVGDLKMIPVANWPAYKGRGGLANGVEMMQIEGYINALNTLVQARQQAQQQLYETTKASDLLRGVSNPDKTATANRLENAWSSLGLIVRQNQFAAFISDGLQKLSTIIAEKFEPERILEIADADSLVYPLIQQEEGVDPQQQAEAMKAEIIRVLQDEDERCYRITVTSDSLVALDERQERADAVDLIQSAGSFFQQMDALIEKYPPLTSFAMQLQSYVMKFYKGGKELDGIYQKALADVAGLIQQKTQQASQQPPDPKLIESQTRLQIATQEAQTKQSIAQMEAQSRYQRDMVEVQAMQAKNQREAENIAFEQWKVQQELGLEQQKLALQAQKMQMDAQAKLSELGIKQDENEIKKEVARIGQIIELQDIELKRQQGQQRITESLMEEARLASQVANERLTQIQQEAQQTVKQSSAPAPVINVHIPANKPGKKVVRFDEDLTGKLTGGSIEDLIDEVE
jgi:hypothetical protein